MLKPFKYESCNLKKLFIIQMLDRKTMQYFPDEHRIITTVHKLLYYLYR